MWYEQYCKYILDIDTVVWALFIDIKESMSHSEVEGIRVARGGVGYLSVTAAGG